MNRHRHIWCVVTETRRIILDDTRTTRSYPTKAAALAAVDRLNRKGGTSRHSFLVAIPMGLAESDGAAV